MDLTPSDEQRLLRESAERFIAETYTSKQREKNAAEPLGFSAAIWKQFAELGWLALPIAEEHGGLGGGAVDVGILMEAFGKGLVSEPYLATVVLGAGLIAEAGSDAQKAALLPKVADGSLHLAFAHAERAARSDLSLVETTATSADGGWRISGRKIAVLDGRAAQHLIVSARVTSEANRLALFLVPVNAPGLTMQDYPRLGGGQGCNVSLDDVQVSADARLGTADAMPAVEAVTDRALAALSSEAVGIMQVLLDKTLDYTKIRKQFGRPLASNQVIKHRLVDMSVACDEARSMALRAAMLADAPPLQRARAASGAKAKIGKGARFVAEQSVQCHGAMGVTEELDIGAYFKRLLAFEALFGGTTHHYRRHAALAAGTATAA
jgi:alkylation response protein AidB-like acyl-CoA dehydrogenase